MKIGKFLGGVAALVWNPTTKCYLILRRASDRDFKAGDWECVTGRVDQGESFEQALHREVKEEIDASIMIDFIIATTHFYRGDPIPENELLGVMYACTIIDPGEIRFGDEHSEICWVTAAEALNLFPCDHWLHQVIRRTEEIRKYYPAKLQQMNREGGFEI